MFRLLRLRARRAPGLIEDAKDVLLELFSVDAEYSADTLEGIYDELEKVSKMVLSGDVTDELASEVLGAIARQEDLNGRFSNYSPAQLRNFRFEFAFLEVLVG